MLVLGSHMVQGETVGTAGVWPHCISGAGDSCRMARQAAKAARRRYRLLTRRTGRVQSRDWVLVAPLVIDSSGRRADFYDSVS